MIYGSICSGIEAATVAWHPLGWRPAFFSEIEKFPSAVLAHHYPHVPNLGDMTRHEEWDHEPIDLLVGGTPCQDFSIAGLRAGLAGERGQLSIEFGRVLARSRPRWFVWENVPGVLSKNGGQDFATILGLFSGQNVSTPPEGWQNFGIIPGYRNAYGLAYRVLDAQYVRVDGFGRAVPQRRRRVFVVGYIGDWRRAAAVLFEREGLRGDSPPRREAGERVAPTVSARPTGGGGLGTDFDCDGGLIFGGGPDDGKISGTVSSKWSKWSKGSGGPAGDEAYNLVAFDCKASGRNGFGTGEISPTLRSMNSAEGRDNGGGQVAIAIQERALCENPNAGPDGAGFRVDGAAYTLEARTVPQAVAFDLRGRDGGAMPEGPHDTANIRAASGGSSRSYLATPWAVRRLTPRECERLQGFPDGYTDIPWRKRNWTPDGPRYKALGNSMAVNCMRWLGMRIQMVEALN